MAKKILKCGIIAFAGMFIGLAVWLLAFNGVEKLQAQVKFPDKPQGTYSGFYYNKLSDNEKIVYEVIMGKIDKMPKKIRVPDLNEESLKKVFDALHYDNAEFFFLGENCVIETSFSACYFVPEYLMSEKEYEKCMKELEKEKNKIVKTVSGFTDDFEKELYIHNYIIDKCQYVDKVGGAFSSSYGCLVKGTASCEGYAKAAKYLLDAVGIENYIASGVTHAYNEKESEGHAWNIVKINSGYYHLDVTWDDPVNPEVENRYAYFNVSDKELSKTHDIDKAFSGVCISDKENYYVKKSLVFSSYDSKTRDAMVSEMARCITKGEKTLSFKVTDEKTLKVIKEELFDMNGIYSVLFSASTVADKPVPREGISYAIDEKHMIIIITDFA